MSELKLAISPDFNRVVEAEQTLSRIEPLLPVFGITRVADITGLDEIGVPVYNVIRPNSRSLSVSQGKGLTTCAAKVSGVMESIENFHAESIDQPIYFCSYNELKFQKKAINPYLLPLTPISTYSHSKPIGWIESFELNEEKSYLIPYEIINGNYTSNNKLRMGMFPESGNGLASGNNKLEAILHGLLEVVERDAYTMWAYTPTEKKKHTLVNLDTCKYSIIKELIEKITKCNLNLEVWNIASDTEIPSFLSRISQNNQVGAWIGSGSHPNKNVAFLRAVTESIQTRLTMIAGSRDDIEDEEYNQGQGKAWVDYKAICDFEDVYSFDSLNIEIQLHWCIQQLKSIGIDKIFLTDLSKPEFNIDVIKIVIPKLEWAHNEMGYKPRTRLYEWLSKNK